MLKRPFIRFVVGSLKGFVNDLPMIHSAALSYYVLLAFVPLLYLSFSIFGKVVGQERFMEIVGSLLNEYIGISDLSGFELLMEKFDVSSSSFFLQVSGAFMMVFSITGMLNALKKSINIFYGVKAVPGKASKMVLTHLLFRLISILMIIGFTLLVIVLYFAESIFLSLGDKFLNDLNLMHEVYLTFLRIALPVFTNFIVMTVLFKFLHDGYIQWRFALKGAFITGLLLFLGQYVLRVYLSQYFFASGVGMAGSILVIMAWVYYSALIIFLGARFTADYATFKGFPVGKRLKAE